MVVALKNKLKCRTFTSYIENISNINGITDDDVKGCLKIGEVIPKLLEFVGEDVLVAHNASFDMKFLLAKMHENIIEYRKFKVIDTLSLARKNIDFTKNHKLETMKSFLKLNHLSSHDALHDCYVTAELYKYCFKENT
jgi:DNA polymerase-3 subunit epsilon